MPYSPIQYLCWLFSGAEISLLKECPTDYNRQASIGFTILMTCLFAGFAGGFAAWRFSGGNIFATVIFGIVWAMLIFSIDRSMVVTLKKDPTKEDGKWVKVAAFAARAILSGLLAFMISIPLEIYIFKDEIGIQLQQDDVTLATDQQQKWQKQLGLGSAEASRARLEAERDRNERLASSKPQTPEYQAAEEDVANQQRLANSRRAAAGKIDLNRLEAKIPVDDEGEKLAGPAYTRWRQAVQARRALMQEASVADSKAQKNRATMRALAIAESNSRRVAANQASVEAQQESGRIKQINGSLALKDQDIKSALAQKGFLREYVALTNASKDPKKGELGFLLWLIRGIMFVIELLPTIVKLATPIGEYDRQLHAHEQLFALALQTNYQIMQGREQLRQQTEQEIAEQLEQARRDRELELGKNVLDRTATLQNDLAERMLKDWYKQERDKQKAASLPKNQPAAQVAVPSSSVAPVPITIVNPVNPPVIATAQVLPTIQPVITPVVPLPPTVPSALPAEPIPTVALPTATTSSVTLAALTSKDFWWLPPGNRRNWYRFENGSTNNQVRRKINDGQPEMGQWEHPNEDKSLLRITFLADTNEYTIERLTNTEMVLRNAARDEVLNFTA